MIDNVLQHGIENKSVGGKQKKVQKQCKVVETMNCDVALECKYVRRKWQKLQKWKVIEMTNVTWHREETCKRKIEVGSIVKVNQVVSNPLLEI